MNCAVVYILVGSGIYPYELDGLARLRRVLLLSVDMVWCGAVRRGRMLGCTGVNHNDDIAFSSEVRIDVGSL